MQYVVRCFIWLLAFSLITACAGGGGGNLMPSPSQPQASAPPSTPPSSGVVLSSDPAPATVHFSSVTTPEQTAGGVTIGSDRLVYLSGATSFLKYRASSFAKYPYIFSSGQTQMFVPIPRLRTGPGGTIWTASEQCCSPPTGYDFQYFETVDTSGNVRISDLVTDTHFGGGITSFALGSDGNMWSDIFCNPAVCGGVQSSVLLFDAAFHQTSGPVIQAPDQLGEITTGPDGAIYAIDYQPFVKTAIVRIDVHSRAITRSYPLPNFVPNEITELTSGPDGALWFTASKANEIGRLKLDGTFTSYALPTANAGLGGIAAASDNAMWFTETNANKIGRIALDGTIHEYPIPTAAGPIGITAGAPACTPGTVYFTETNALGILAF